jgi:hypothetical protein
LFFETKSYYVPQADLKVMILPFQPLKCWDYRRIPLYPAMASVLENYTSPNWPITFPIMLSSNYKNLHSSVLGDTSHKYHIEVPIKITNSSSLHICSLYKH